MSAIRYAFSRNELSNWKARITERLVELYIKQRLMPKLMKQEDWDLMIYLTSAWFSTSKDEELMPCLSYQEQAFFLSNNLIPTAELLGDFKNITRTLSNVPDGFFFKLKKVGKSRILRNVKEMRLDSAIDFTLGRLNFTSGKYRNMMQERLPVVSGEIEIVEVKSGTARLASNQIKSYTDVLRRGYPLRYFYVDFISFELNEFELEERLFTTPNELTTFSTKGKTK